MEHGRFCKLNPCLGCGKLVGRGSKRCPPCAVKIKRKRDLEAKRVAAPSKYVVHFKREGKELTAQCTGWTDWPLERLTDDLSAVTCKYCRYWLGLGPLRGYWLT